jgi:prophage regulatory protein
MSAALPDHPRIERLPQVITRVGMGRSWIYARIAEGGFPAPVRLGKGAVGWFSDDIDAWLNALRPTRACRRLKVDLLPSGGEGPCPSAKAKMQNYQKI